LKITSYNRYINFGDNVSDEDEVEESMADTEKKCNPLIDIWQRFEEEKQDLMHALKGEDKLGLLIRFNTAQPGIHSQWKINSILPNL